MPWEEKGLAQMREEFVARVQSGEKSKAALCREYGITRRTGDKWLARFRSGESLEDRSRSPFHTPNKTDVDIERRIVEYRREHPGIGASKIHCILQRDEHITVPSVKTVNNILKRNGLILPEDSRAATPHQRYEKDYPNEMWQADYKGDFLMEDRNRCHPLNIIDDCTRFNICCKAMSTETFEEIKPVMIALFREYGMPFSLLCDNGNPWGTAQSTGYTRFEVWLMELGILTLHGRALHPQTQGKDESFNRSMTKELLRYRKFADMEDAEESFRRYRDFYNNERPHMAINMEVPAARYSPSERAYPETIGAWEYPNGCELRRVRSSGYFNLCGNGYFLSEAFGEKEIAVSRSQEDKCYDLYFRQFHIGRINTEKRVFTFKRAYLIEEDPRTADRKPR